MENYFELKLKSVSENEKFARNTVAGFLVPLDPTLSELDDIKTAVSEAVTNCIVHGYEGATDCEILIKVATEGNKATITITDFGVGIGDIEQAITPFYTTKPDSDRSGMGFTLMQSFMDEFEVLSETNKGTTITMTKIIGSEGTHDWWDRNKTIDRACTKRR